MNYSNIVNPFSHRTISETSAYAYSVRDTNAVLEKVMEAKLLREGRLQEDDSELGSMPSIFIVRQQSRKNSMSGHSRVHKLSFSDRGEMTGHLGSPMSSVPRIVVQDGPEPQPPSSLVTSALARLSEADNSPDKDWVEDTLIEEDEVMEDDVTGNDAKSKPRSEETSPKPSEDVASTSDETFNDAESGTLGEGTNTEKSEFFTPPTSPADTSSPSSPEKENREVNTSPGKRMSVPEVSYFIFILLAYCPIAGSLTPSGKLAS